MLPLPSCWLLLPLYPGAGAAAAAAVNAAGARSPTHPPNLCTRPWLAAAVAYLLFPQPIYRGPSAVLPLTPASFRELVEGTSPSNTSWLVQFYAPWSPPCIHLEPAVAELSLRYGTAPSRLRFGRVDAARWPALAEAHKVVGGVGWGGQGPG